MCDCAVWKKSNACATATFIESKQTGARSDIDNEFWSHMLVNILIIEPLNIVSFFHFFKIALHWIFSTDLSWVELSRECAEIFCVVLLSDFITERAKLFKCNSILGYLNFELCFFLHLKNNNSNNYTTHSPKYETKCEEQRFNVKSCHVIVMQLSDVILLKSTWFVWNWQWLIDDVVVVVVFLNGVNNLWLKGSVRWSIEFALAMLLPMMIFFGWTSNVNATAGP